MIVGIVYTMENQFLFEQAKKAVTLLVKLNLIVRDAKGYYRATDKIITTGDEVSSMHVKNFQKSMMDLAKESLDRHPALHRNISTVTFNISKETYNNLNAKTKERFTDLGVHKIRGKSTPLHVYGALTIQYIESKQ